MIYKIENDRIKVTDKSQFNPKHILECGQVFRFGKDENNNYFASAALTRRQSRDEALDVLALVCSSEDADEATKAEAQAKISKIATDIQNEANIETLVKAKGFEECVAVIGEGCVSVIVSAEALQAKDTAQILAIVYETTGISPEHVSIINK